MQSFILGEWNWPISCLKDPETQEKGLYFLGCQNLKNFQGDLGPRPPRSLRLRRSFRKSVSIYPRSAPGNSVSKGRYYCKTYSVRIVVSLRCSFTEVKLVC